jgi:Protein of unknown function (DUF2934)
MTKTKKSAVTSDSDETVRQSPRFDPPHEADWHRMISEAAYFCAEKRGFIGGRALDDWLAAEGQVRSLLSSSK